MSKKDYINAVNEINVNETLKQETLKKATNTKKNSKYRYNKIYPIASLAFMCAIILIEYSVFYYIKLKNI